MDELRSEIRFRPKTVSDERYVYRAMPIAWTDSEVVILNEYGATVCRAGDSRSIDIPDGDEVLLGSNGAIYACQFNDQELNVEQFEYDGELFTSSGLSWIVDISYFACDELVILSVPEGIELWFDNRTICRRICSIKGGVMTEEQASVSMRPLGELSFSSGKMVGFADDQGVSGKLLNLVDLESQQIWHIRAEFALTALGRVFAPVKVDPTNINDNYGLYVFSQEQRNFLKVPGPILEAAGNSNRVVLSVFVNGDAQLFEVVEAETGDLTLRCFQSHSGYKVISLDGSVCVTRGFSNEIKISPTSYQPQLLSNVVPEGIPFLSYSYNTNIVTSYTHKETVGAVIHFHGGPESQEVPEGRYFGLPQWCNENGLDWVGINYQGSLTQDLSHTRSAWHRWKKAMHEDLLKAIELTSGPIVLMGWSFGATLSLALGDP